MAKRNKEEEKIQAQCWQWFNNNFCLVHHSPRLVMFSVPNEIQGNNIVGSNTANAMGRLAGVSDTIILLPNGVSLFIEFKTPKGRQSDKQKDFEQRITKLVFEYKIIRSLEQFKEYIHKKTKDL